MTNVMNFPTWAETLPEERNGERSVAPTESLGVPKFEVSKHISGKVSCHASKEPYRLSNADCLIAPVDAKLKGNGSLSRAAFSAAGKAVRRELRELLRAKAQQSGGADLRFHTGDVGVTSAGQIDGFKHIIHVWCSCKCLIFYCVPFVNVSRPVIITG